MTPRRLLVLVSVAVASLAVAPAAGAIPNTCPTTGPDAGTVRITEPGAGARFGGQVTVRGRAMASTGVSRVELFVGEALKDFQVLEPSQADVEFLLRFDAAGVQSANPTLSVVACGGSPGAIVRGFASVGVQIDRAAAAPTEPIALTPVDGADERPSGAGPLWVGASFGLAGLAGLVVAMRFSRAPGVRSPVLAPAVRTRPGRERPAVADGVSPARPNPAGPPPAGGLAALESRPGVAPGRGPEGALGARPGRADEREGEPAATQGAFGGVGWVAAKPAAPGVDAEGPVRPDRAERPPGSRRRSRSGRRFRPGAGDSDARPAQPT